jgi:hypothetical protein
LDGAPDSRERQRLVAMKSQPTLHFAKQPLELGRWLARQLRTGLVFFQRLVG